ncbi:MAG: ABC transporter substrate-binding protein [Clostridia bacterium]|nr:ABC transporter substrate-binding protein [Clostridia bacterium]
MKKILAMMTALVLALSLCAVGYADGEKVTVRLGGLKGPTSMGMVKLLDDAENGLTENSYAFQMAAAADELTPGLLKGELDILAVPANLGAILYKNSAGAVQMAAVNTLGVIYIVEKGGETVQTLEDLKGKTIYATGKGTTPEYALTYLLSQHGLDINTDVTMEWKSEPTEVVAQMATEEASVAMLPQPFVTVAAGQLENLRVALDLTGEWNALDNGSQFVTAGLIVRKAFAEEQPEALKTFLKEYAASTAYVNESPAEAAQLIEKYGIVKAPVAEKAIPFCNIVCITGAEMQQMVSGYLEVLLAQNPKAVGGELPGEDFFLIYE